MLKQNEKWFYAGSQMEIVSQYKYLGIVFNSFQKWNLVHDTLANQGTKAFIHLFTLSWKVCAMEYHVQHTFDLFDKVVVPILCYGAEVWGHEWIERIERIHLKLELCTILLKRQQSYALSTYYHMHTIYNTYMSNAHMMWMCLT